MLVGLEQERRWKKLLKNKRIGLVTTPASKDIGVLASETELVALFGPEHGVRGNEEAGKTIDDGVDEATGLPVYSLYQGESSKLPDGITDKIDVLVYDIQDVGLRYYTFVATLKALVKDCAAKGLPLVVLDRPNPLGGLVAEGNILSSDEWNFVCPDELPIRYGMTSGELAQWFNQKESNKADLTVIPLSGWNRTMLWPDTFRRWIPTSPSIPSFLSAFCYSGTCLFEGTTLSEGRGTDVPFQIFGSPTMDAKRLIDEVKEPGLNLVPCTFVPTTSKWQGQLCNGIYIQILDCLKADMLSVTVHLLTLMRDCDPSFALLPPKQEGAVSPMERLVGKEDAKRMFEQPDWVLTAWKREGAEFMKTIKEVLLYA